MTAQFERSKRSEFHRVPGRQSAAKSSNSRAENFRAAHPARRKFILCAQNSTYQAKGRAQ